MAELELERLHPDPGPVGITEQLAAFAPRAAAGARRPYVYSNFVLSLDGRATLRGVAGTLGSRTDVELLMGLRACADAVLVGAGTVRIERYGRLLPRPELRREREERGAAPDPLAVVASDSLKLPWEAGLFSSGFGEVVILTSSEREAPPTATPLSVWRSPAPLDLAAALERLRAEREVGALLCEGGPRLHGELAAADLLDELFITHSPKLVGGDGPRLLGGIEERERSAELRWLLRSGDELYARYALSSDD